MEPPASASSVLQKLSELSPHQLAFLDKHIRCREDLSTLPDLSSELSKSCSDLDDSLVNLRKHLIKLVVSWVYRSLGAKSSIQNLSFKLENLSLCSSHNVSESKRMQKIFSIELPQLAREVQRIDNIREYVETALRLEGLIGDLEDSVFGVINRQCSSVFSEEFASSSASTDPRAKQDKLLGALNLMNSIEDMLIEILKSHPRWKQLLRCVDGRLDKTLAVLRPKVIADHKALLASLGWPPKLVTTNAEGREISGVPNPLVLMQGEKRKRYSYSFLSLCALQHLQTRREDRKQNHSEKKEETIIRLWAIDELVSPIAAQVEYHLSKWTQQPEFMFALVFRITRDFIVGVEDVLQPLIDEARLICFSAREAWFFSMVQMLSHFLKQKTFSSLVERYNRKDMKSEVASSWLYLIDLMVAFDKQMQSLLNPETFMYMNRDASPGLFRGTSVLNIFSDNPGWLKIWARIEFKDAWGKLKAEMKDGKAWMLHRKSDTGYTLYSNSSEDYLLITKEDHKAPFIAELVLKIAWSMIDRCRTLPNTLLQSQFIRSTSGKFFWHFLKVLIAHCQISALHSDGWDCDDDSVTRVCGSINTARYLEFKLREWSDDVNFLEMSVAEDDSKLERTVGADDCCFFAEEIKSLAELEMNWLMEIIALILLQFETLSWEYVNARARFDMGQEISQDAESTVSPDLLRALDALKSVLDLTKTSLNAKDFLDLWRSTADGLDHFIFRSILMSDNHFSSSGTSRFKADMRALYSVFQPYCSRPEAFFPCIRDSLKLLSASMEEVKRLEAVLATVNRQGTVCRQVLGITHLSAEQICEITKNRMF